MLSLKDAFIKIKIKKKIYEKLLQNRVLNFKNIIYIYIYISKCLTKQTLINILTCQYLSKIINLMT